jgi:hypothetical protein
MHAVGSSSRLTLAVTIGRKKVDATVRSNLFGSDLGVIVGPYEYRGLLLVPRWEELINLLGQGQSRRVYRWRPEDLHYQGVGSIYHGLRQIEHILAAYGFRLDQGEKALVLRAREAALHANLIALGLRTGTVDETSESLRTVTDEIIHELGNPRNLPKREGRDYLADLVSKPSSWSTLWPRLLVSRSASKTGSCGSSRSLWRGRGRSSISTSWPGSRST